MEPKEKRLEEEIAEWLNRAQTTGNNEDQEFGSDSRGDELPNKLARRESRL